MDRHFLLIYPTDAYFFVAKGNATLAALLEQGLRAATKDGPAAPLPLSGQPESLRAGQALQRQIIYLHNPLLPPLTPVNESRLWFSPAEQQQNVNINNQ